MVRAMVAPSGPARFAAAAPAGPAVRSAVKAAGSALDGTGEGIALIDTGTVPVPRQPAAHVVDRPRIVAPGI
jgi:hypothetical protein